jgi:hypothetical protein
MDHVLRHGMSVKVATWYQLSQSQLCQVDSEAHYPSLHVAVRNTPVTVTVTVTAILRYTVSQSLLSAM